MSEFGIDVRREPEGIAWLELRNPDRLNAVRFEMWQAIPDAVAALAADPTVRVLALRGAGDAAFASGADISEFVTRRRDAASARAYEEVTARAFAALTAVEQPVVAVIHGVCIGGGLALAASADLRIAADDARVALPAARLGLGYHLSGVERLVELVGASAAAELFFTARQYTAAEALRLGLVNQVAPKAELDAFALRYLRDIARNAPLTLRAAKRAIAEVRRDAERRDVGAVGRLIGACFESADYAEGVAAFLEKRPARFRGV
ncbi:MAG: enoyl-CoA hydratase [Candidatus Binatia bacterium]